uniref:Uncharacterized protein n=1 Tax=Oryza rufipogon TaxID=4529 RepID=A0A0E0P6M2_ORYRU
MGEADRWRCASRDEDPSPPSRTHPRLLSPQLPSPTVAPNLAIIPEKKNSPFSLLPSPGRHRRRSRAAHSRSSRRQITARPHLHSSSLRPSSPPPHPPLPSGSLPLASSVTALPSSSPSGSPPLPASSPRARRRRGGPNPFSLRGRGVRRTPPPPPFCAASSRHARPRTASDEQAWRARRGARPPPLPPLPSVSVRVESKGEADRLMHGRGGSVEVCFQGRRVRAASDRRLDALPIDLEVGFPGRRGGLRLVMETETGDFC